MKPRVITLSALVILGGSAVATVAAAHHAMVMYDRTRTETLTGTVVELRWTNPHVFLLVNGKVDEAQEVGLWRLETSVPFSRLLRRSTLRRGARAPRDDLEMAASSRSPRARAHGSATRSGPRTPRSGR